MFELLEKGFQHGYISPDPFKKATKSLKEKHELDKNLKDAKLAVESANKKLIEQKKLINKTEEQFKEGALTQ